MANYTYCDRCDEKIDLDSIIVAGVNYKNAYLCLRCSKIRQFDDDNPIMYPIYKD